MADAKLPAKKDQSLYDLVSISQEIKRSLIENFGEMTPEVESSLLTLEERLPNKADGYRFITEDLRHEADLWKERAHTFLAVAKSFSIHADKMEGAIKEACIQMGVEELEGNEFRWKLQKAKPTIIIDDETKVPSGHKEIVQVTKIRKDGILEDLKSGIPVPGCHLEESVYVRCYTNSKKGSKK